MRRLTEQEIDTMKQYKQSGRSIKSIASAMGVSVLTVEYHTVPGFKEKCREKARKWLAKGENKEKRQEKLREWYAKEGNKEKCRENVYKWRAREENKEKQRIYTRDYCRQYRLGTVLNGVAVSIRTKKRPRPNGCELCNQFRKTLGYHHWDDNNPALGMWLDHRCHLLVEMVERFGKDKVLEIVDNYISMKSEITTGTV